MQRRLQRGLSLIEITVALAIGAVLLLGLTQVFSASRAAYQMSEGMARVQENARFAMEFLQRDVRMAGHYGCVNDQSHLQSAGALTSHFGTTAFGDALDFAVSIHGYEAPGTGPGNNVQIGEGNTPVGLPTAIQALDPYVNSDILVLRYLTGSGAPVIAINDPGGGEVLTLASGRWDSLATGGVANPVLFGVADCSYVDIFRGASAGGAGEVEVAVAGAAAGSTDLMRRYTPHPSGQTMLYRAESIVYYVSANAQGVPALYRASFDGTAYVPEELVEGIESLQLVFGMDRNADLSAAPPTGYVDRLSVADATWGAVDWRGTAAVQVGLLARSPNPAVAEQAPQRHVLGVSFTPPTVDDRMYRAGYETTIALRNRLYGN